MKLSNQAHKNITVMVLWILIATLGRIVPHLPNMTPLMALSLLAGATLDKKYAVSIVLVSLLLSDAVLAYLLGYPWLGGWSFFVYSGFLTVALVGSRLSLHSKYSKLAMFTVFSSFGYWLWTNLGAWWLSYAHSLFGLVDCYVLALPFLRNEILGNMLWVVFLFSLKRHYLKCYPPTFVG
ncbi:MAG: hypothetical protein P1U40_08855 [Coxiellaceae bacterium]|nr:hypothetical protein [Coxiellaceae bacterium]